ncbi:MAG: OBAP family protein, partial [Gemmatimonadota bacterium]|nr:OBAP family protein [Gemmatimonadota bacterium]
MRRLLPLVSVVAVVLAASLASGRLAPGTAAQDATPAAANPGGGERGHFDLAVHFPWDPALIAHHWCKPVAGGFVECLIYASDDPDAPLVAVEEVVPEAVYNGFAPAEQRLWHSNVAEAAAGSDPNRPAPSLAEAATAAAEAGGATYGKLILLGDPETLGDLPMG